MSSIDDLRCTLERHADGFHDHDVHIRPVAVRERVRAVRRRRRATVAGLAAVVVAGVAVTVAGLGGDRGPAPAGRTLAGHEAPGTMTSLGYTYAFADGREADGLASVQLAVSDRPRLISWATEGSDDVTLREPGEAPRDSAAADFADFTLVPPGASGRYAVKGDGTVALAVYDLTDVAPPGETRDGITFRDDVAGQRLNAAAIGEPGDADLALDLDLGAGPASFSYLCSGGPRSAWIHIALDGEQVVFGAGCDDSTFDPGGSGGFSQYVGAAKGADLHVRMWVTDGEKGAVIDDPDLRIGVASYTSAPAVTRLAGSPLSETLEYDGHVWQYVDSVFGTPGQRRLDVDALPGEATLVHMAFRHTGRATVRTREDGGPGYSSFATGGAGSTDTRIDADGSAGLRVQGDARPDVELGLARYRRAD